VGGKEVAEIGGEELAAIVALDATDVGVELCGNEREKRRRVAPVSDLLCKGNTHEKCEKSSRITM
jgi:hypothetical protein